MKHSKTTVILTISISIALFVFGFYSFGSIYEAMLPKVDNGSYQVTELGGQFQTSLMFALIFGLTPILIWATWRLAPITLNKQKIYTVLTVVICMILSVLLRQQMIKLYFRRLTEPFNSTKDNLSAIYPFDKVHFEYYMFGGLIIGCLISFLLLRQRKV